jgi:hypothetical protein
LPIPPLGPAHDISTETVNNSLDLWITSTVPHRGAGVA